MKASIDLCIYLFKVPLPRKKLKKLGIARYTGILNDNGKQVVIPETYNKLGSTIYMMKDLLACCVCNDDGTIDLEDVEKWGIDATNGFDSKRWEKIRKEFCEIMLDNKKVSYIARRLPTKIHINNEGLEPHNKVYMRYDWTELDRKKPKFRNRRINNIVKAYNLSYKWKTEMYSLDREVILN